MRFLLKYFSYRNHIFLLGFYILISLVLMNFNDSITLRGLRILLLNFVGWVNSAENKLVYLENLDKENISLKRQNLHLSVANQQLQEIILENIRLRRLLEIKKNSLFEYQAANVIGRGQEETVGSIILDVGKKLGVEKNMPLITDLGLVGKILRVEENYAVAQILFDRNALVSARLQNSREIGTISWGGNVWLDLLYISKDVEVTPGETVITSGLSQIYPAGLKIGIVGEVEQIEYSLFKRIKVRPSVNFNSLEEVFVILLKDSLTMELNSIE
jgi:rod shape-determining protein MreC